MSRDEALRRLEGTWSFEVVGNHVMIRDLSLLSAIAGLRDERAPVVAEHVQVVPDVPQGAAFSGD